MAIPAVKPPLPGASPGVKAGGVPGIPPGVSGKPAATKPAASGAVAVRSVVDTDSAGTALAIAALVASLISFGIVLMSFLEK